jgi:hypothetical protein
MYYPGMPNMKEMCKRRGKLSERMGFLCERSWFLVQTEGNKLSFRSVSRRREIPQGQPSSIRRFLTSFHSIRNDS